MTIQVQLRKHIAQDPRRVGPQSFHPHGVCLLGAMNETKIQSPIAPRPLNVQTEQAVASQAFLRPQTHGFNRIGAGETRRPDVWNLLHQSIQPRWPGETL